MKTNIPSPANKITGERRPEKAWCIVFGVMLAAYILLLADFLKLNNVMKQLRDDYEQELKQVNEYNVELNEMLHLLKTNLEKTN